METETVFLTQQDWDLFFVVVTTPPAPNQALVALLREGDTDGAIKGTK